MNNLKFSVVTGCVVKKILDENTNAVFEIIKGTYIAHHTQRTCNPHSHFLTFPEKPHNRIIALPAALKETKIAGIKWIASYPENTKNSLPRASAVIILNDYETGFPYVCMEGATISAIRTAFSAVLAAEYMQKGNKQIRSMGIVGTSHIARNIFNAFLSQNWKINSVVLYDKNFQTSKQFAEEVVLKNHFQCKISENIEDVITESDLIVFATTAPIPHVERLDLLQHNPKILHISLRDIAPHLLLHSDNITDDVDHVLTANTSAHLAYQTCHHKNFIKGTIGQLLSSELLLSEDKPVIFSPMGMGILDIALAEFVYQTSLKNNAYIGINQFF